MLFFSTVSDLSYNDQDIRNKLRDLEAIIKKISDLINSYSYAKKFQNDLDTFNAKLKKLQDVFRNRTSDSIMKKEDLRRKEFNPIEQQISFAQQLLEIIYLEGVQTALVNIDKIVPFPEVQINQHISLQINLLILLVTKIAGCRLYTSACEQPYPLLQEIEKLIAKLVTSDEIKWLQKQRFPFLYSQSSHDISLFVTPDVFYLMQKVEIWRSELYLPIGNIDEVLKAISSIEDDVKRQQLVKYLISLMERKEIEDEHFQRLLKQVEQDDLTLNRNNAVKGWLSLKKLERDIADEIKNFPKENQFHKDFDKLRSKLDTDLSELNHPGPDAEVTIAKLNEEYQKIIPSNQRLLEEIRQAKLTNRELLQEIKKKASEFTDLNSKLPLSQCLIEQKTKKLINDEELDLVNILVGFLGLITSLQICATERLTEHSDRSELLRTSKLYELLKTQLDQIKVIYDQISNDRPKEFVSQLKQHLFAMLHASVNNSVPYLEMVDQQLQGLEYSDETFDCFKSMLKMYIVNVKDWLYHPENQTKDNILNGFKVLNVESTFVSFLQQQNLSQVLSHLARINKEIQDKESEKKGLQEGSLVKAKVEKFNKQIENIKKGIGRWNEGVRDDVERVRDDVERDEEKKCAECNRKMRNKQIYYEIGEIFNPYFDANGSNDEKMHILAAIEEKIMFLESVPDILKIFKEFNGSINAETSVKELKGMLSLRFGAYKFNLNQKGVVDYKVNALIDKFSETFSSNGDEEITIEEFKGKLDKKISSLTLIDKAREVPIWKHLKACFEMHREEISRAEEETPKQIEKFDAEITELEIQRRAILSEPMKNFGELLCTLGWTPKKPGENNIPDSNINGSVKEIKDKLSSLQSRVIGNEMNIEEIGTKLQELENMARQYDLARKHINGLSSSQVAIVEQYIKIMSSEAEKLQQSLNEIEEKIADKIQHLNEKPNLKRQIQQLGENVSSNFNNLMPQLQQLGLDTQDEQTQLNGLVREINMLTQIDNINPTERSTCKEVADYYNDLNQRLERLKSIDRSSPEWQERLKVLGEKAEIKSQLEQVKEQMNSVNKYIPENCSYEKNQVSEWLLMFAEMINKLRKTEIDELNGKLEKGKEIISNMQMFLKKKEIRKLQRQIDNKYEIIISFNRELRQDVKELSDTKNDLDNRISNMEGEDFEGLMGSCQVFLTALTTREQQIRETLEGELAKKKDLVAKLQGEITDAEKDLIAIPVQKWALSQNISGSISKTLSEIEQLIYPKKGIGVFCKSDNHALKKLLKELKVIQLGSELDFYQHLTQLELLVQDLPDDKKSVIRNKIRELKQLKYQSTEGLDAEYKNMSDQIAPKMKEQKAAELEVKGLEKLLKSSNRKKPRVAEIEDLKPEFGLPLKSEKNDSDESSNPFRP